MEDFVKSTLKNVRPEMDQEYCAKHDLKFENGERDADSVEIFSKEGADFAKDILDS